MKHEIKHKLIEVKVLSKNEERVEYNTSEILIESFIEDWNDRNPKKKLAPGTIDLIMDYLRIAYVGGWDDHRLIIEKTLKLSGLTINKHFFEKLLRDFEQEI